MNVCECDPHMTGLVLKHIWNRVGMKPDVITGSKSGMSPSSIKSTRD
jgi:hypothetical protein